MKMNDDLRYNIKLGLATNIKNKDDFKIIINYILELESANRILNFQVKDLSSKISKIKEYIKHFNLEAVKLDSGSWYECLIEILNIIDSIEDENERN